MVNKLDRKILRMLLEDVLSSASITGENPFEVKLGSERYVVYIKNLSSAYFSNRDITRVQLPNREDFKIYKESKELFILLGYDSEYDVYVTWNPFDVKERLNLSESVSFYSRLSFQQLVNEKQSIQKYVLTNNIEIFAFPRTLIKEFLQNITMYFPVSQNDTALAHSTQIYLKMIEEQNVKTFRTYLEEKKYSLRTIVNYTNAISELIQKKYFELQKEMFTFYISLKDYESAVSIFFKNPELKKLNVLSHYTHSSALKQYLEFLDKTGDFALRMPDDHNTSDSDADDKFIDSNGKLIKITNVELLSSLKECLDTEYKSYTKAYNLIDEFYGDKFADTMELKDWSALLMNIDWTSVTAQTVSKNFPGRKSASSKAKPINTTNTSSQEVPSKSVNKKQSCIDISKFPISKKLLRVYYKDGKCVFYPKINDTFSEVIDNSFPDLIHEMNIVVSGVNIVSKEFDKKHSLGIREISEGWHVYTSMTVEKKAFILMQISQELDLDLKVELVSFNLKREERVEIPSSVGITTKKILKVTYPDGRVSADLTVSNTYMDAIRYIGVRRVRDLNIKVPGDNIILTERPQNCSYSSSFKYLDGLYVNTCCGTIRKFEILQEINSILGLKLKIELI